MVVTLGQKWEARGEARGEVRGEVRGEIKKAHLVILRGCYRGYNADMLADLSQLPMEEVQNLEQGFSMIKKAWNKQQIDILTLIAQTKFTEDEVKFVLSCLNTPSA